MIKENHINHSIIHNNIIETVLELYHIGTNVIKIFLIVIVDFWQLLSTILREINVI